MLELLLVVLGVDVFPVVASLHPMSNFSGGEKKKRRLQASGSTWMLNTKLIRIITEKRTD